MRRTLLLGLLLPLMAVVALSSLGAYAMADYFAERVLDQWLHDSALALAHQVRDDDGHLRVDLSRSAFDVLGFDVVDNLYFRVTSQRSGELLANTRLQPPVAATRLGAQPLYFDAAIDGKPVRALALRVGTIHDDVVTLLVAETRVKRNAWAQRVFTDALLLSSALAVACASIIWLAIGRGVHLLEGVVRAIRASRSTGLRSGTVPATPPPVPSEMQPLVDELDALLAERAEVHRSYERFIGNAAHQLRTPLASLAVQLDLARGEGDAARLQAAVAQAQHDVQRLGHLLHQLLTLARVEEDHGLALEPTDLDALARALVEERIDAATALGIDLGYAAPAGPATVPAKAALVREALDNLIDNALKYGGAGGQVTVGVTAEPPSLWVEDHGPGIAAADRERVKERFVRLPGQAANGCGLGLAIVDEIARRHGAALRLEDGPGAGLRATLCFA
jgi:two-component system sensor histidine kinase TctE